MEFCLSGGLGARIELFKLLKCELDAVALVLADSCKSYFVLLLSVTADFVYCSLLLPIFILCYF